MACRRSSRIYERDQRKYIETKTQIVLLANKPTANITEKANNVKEMCQKMIEEIIPNKELISSFQHIMNDKKINSLLENVITSMCNENDLKN